MGESFPPSKAFSLGDLGNDFSSVATASEIALSPVARYLVYRPGGAGEGVGLSSDEVSLAGTFGDTAMASMLGESPYSSLVTVGDKGDETLRVLVN